MAKRDPCESGLFTYLVDNLHVMADYHAIKKKANINTMVYGIYYPNKCEIKKGLRKLPKLLYLK